MIVACPLCQTRFLVAAGLFTGGGRSVRCGRCRHVWMAEVGQQEQEASKPAAASGNGDQAAQLAAGSDAEGKTVSGQRGGAAGDTPLGALPIAGHPLRQDMPPFALSAGAANTLSSAAQGRRLPVWTKFAALAGVALPLLGVLLWGVVDRRDIALRWPSMTTVYDGVGLDSHQPGDGIDFRDVKSELVYDGGILRLTVEGRLVNATEKEQKVPHILAVAAGSDGSAIQSWRIDAPVATLAPLATAPFRSTINAPREGVVNVNLNFVGRKNAAD